jgi:RNA polymerase sigma-70 factor (ECF subfamily)
MYMAWEANRQRVFSRLVTDELYTALWRYACRLCDTQADAEDLLQECLVRGYERIDQLLKSANIRAWLFRIMYTVFVNRYHYESHRRSVELLENDAHSACSAERDLEIAAVRRAVKDLSERQREVVEFFYFDELSLEEIAEITETNVNTVKQRLFRARNVLREQLQVVEQTSEGRAG